MEENPSRAVSEGDDATQAFFGQLSPGQQQSPILRWVCHQPPADASKQTRHALVPLTARPNLGRVDFFCTKGISWGPDRLHHHPCHRRQQHRHCHPHCPDVSLHPMTPSPRARTKPMKKRMTTSPLQVTWGRRAGPGHTYLFPQTADFRRSFCVRGVGAQRVRPARKKRKAPNTIAEALPGERNESQSSRTSPARSTAIAMPDATQVGLK